MDEKEVNDAFDALERAFKELAEVEDKQESLSDLLSEYVPESRQAKHIKDQIQELRPKLIEAQRKYRLAAMRIDRTRMLLDVEKIKTCKD
jgi:predicted CopG family antitoxin